MYPASCRRTLLNLAVEQGWGGSDSAQKRQKLYEDVIQTFVTGRA